MMIRPGGKLTKKKSRRKSRKLSRGVVLQHGSKRHHKRSRNHSAVRHSHHNFIMPEESLFSKPMLRRHSGRHSSKASVAKRNSKINLNNLIIPKRSHRSSKLHRHHFRRHGDDSSMQNFDTPNVWDFTPPDSLDTSAVAGRRRRSKSRRSLSRKRHGSKRRSSKRRSSRRSLKRHGSKRRKSSKRRVVSKKHIHSKVGRRKSRKRSLSKKTSLMLHGLGGRRSRKNVASADWMHWGLRKKSRRSRRSRRSKSHVHRLSHGKRRSSARRSASKRRSRHSISGLFMSHSGRKRPFRTRSKSSKMSKLDKLNYIKNKLDGPNNSEIINHHIKIMTSEKKTKKEMIEEIYNRTWLSKSELNSMLKKDVKNKYNAVKHLSIRPRTIIGLVTFLAKREGVKQIHIRQKYKSNSPNFKKNLENAYDSISRNSSKRNSMR